MSAEAKKLTLWRAEWYASSQAQTAYVAAESLTAAAALVDPLVEKSMSEGEAHPAVHIHRHDEVHFS
jgi:hypothetical protein